MLLKCEMIPGKLHNAFQLFPDPTLYSPAEACQPEEKLINREKKCYPAIRSSSNQNTCFEMFYGVFWRTDHIKAQDFRFTFHTPMKEDAVCTREITSHVIDVSHLSTLCHNLSTRLPSITWNVETETFPRIRANKACPASHKIRSMNYFLLHVRFAPPSFHSVMKNLWGEQLSLTIGKVGTNLSSTMRKNAQSMNYSNVWVWM